MKKEVKNSQLLLVAVCIQVILLIWVGGELHSLNAKFGGIVEAGDAREAAAPAPSPSAAPTPAPAAPIDMDKLVDDDDPFKGEADAPVTIVEWSDFQCPFCARFYSQTLGQIEDNYVNDGKVKVVFKHFPLSFHQQAQKAAEASECAKDQGKFWEMHDLLFDNIQSLSDSNFKKWAGDLGLDQAAFDECLDSGKHEAAVKADMAAGQSAGVRGTPGFVVNGKLISGAQPYSVFEAAIEEALN